MIRSVLEGAGLTLFAMVGLVIFVAAFVGVTVWVLTRRQKQVDQWSSIPLEDEPVEPRVPPGDDEPKQAEA